MTDGMTMLIFTHTARILRSPTESAARYMQRLVRERLRIAKSIFHRKTSSERTKLERAQDFENLETGRSQATEFSQTSRLACRKL